SDEYRRLGERALHERGGRCELVDVVGVPQPVRDDAGRHDDHVVGRDVDVFEAAVDAERHPVLVTGEGQRRLTPHPGEEVNVCAFLGEPAFVVEDLLLDVVTLHEYADLPTGQRAGGAGHAVWHGTPPGRQPTAVTRSTRNGPSPSSSRYRWLLQITNLAPMLYRAAVARAWMVYILPPSPVNPTTALCGWASLAPIAPGIPTPSEPPRVRNQCPGVRAGRCALIAGVAVSPSSKTIRSSGARAANACRNTSSIEFSSTVTGDCCVRRASWRASARCRSSGVMTRSSAVASASRVAFGSATRPRDTGWFLAIS